VLVRAVEMRLSSVVKSLLEYGAQPNVNTVNGEPLLIAAIKKQYSSIVMFLLQFGGDASGTKTHVNFLFCIRIFVFNLWLSVRI
jgi:ankyrin repeat protein